MFTYHTACALQLYEPILLLSEQFKPLPHALPYLPCDSPTFTMQSGDTSISSIEKPPPAEQPASEKFPSTKQQPPVVPPKPRPEDIAKSVLDERQVRVFRPSTVRFDPRKLDLPDDFFQPSSSEIATAAHDISLAVERMQNAPLQTRKMRDAEAERRMSRFQNVLIRVLFPDRIALQGIFTPKSTIRQVIRFVKAALLNARAVKFHLFLTPPKTKLLDLDKSLWSLGLVPAALVHIGVDEGPADSAQLLKPCLMNKIEDTPESSFTVPSSAASAPTPPQPTPSLEKYPKKKTSMKTPKWFKK